MRGVCRKIFGPSTANEFDAHPDDTVFVISETVSKDHAVP